MKKILVFSILFAGAAAFGEPNDTFLSISTKGPDMYMDGSTVLDGECYAVVWTKAGATFGGFAADGRLLSENDRLLLVASLAKGGRCPSTLVEIDVKDMDGFKGGTLALYLLDTRVKAADGSVRVGGAGLVAFEAPDALNAAGLAGRADGATGSIGGGAVALAEVGAYAEIGEPRISAFKVEEATVELTVEGMSATADYFVLQGATPSKVEQTMETTFNGEKLTVTKPDAGEMYFRVKLVRKFAK